MTKAIPRHVSPITSMLRNFLLGRKHTNPLRFGDYYAPRTQPPPELPDGPHHKLSSNFYYTHDARREVTPPALIASYQKQIAEPDSKEVATPISASKTPGKVYFWD